MDGETPVSWLMIESGWKVLDSTGTEAGRVEEVVGDTGVDIFNGLSISTGLLSGPRYVPAEEVALITEGEVRLNLDADGINHLARYREPPPSEEIIAPDRKR